MTEQLKPKRRLYQFSLRTILVFVTIASVGFGWLGMKVRAKQRERESVKAIRELGFVVWYDYDFESIVDGIEPPPPGPPWVRKLLGNDFFLYPRTVSFAPHAIDADIEHLYGLRQLKILVMAGTQVTDAGLARLKHLTMLEKLWLTDTTVTDAGIEELQKALPNLKILR